MSFIKNLKRDYDGFAIDIPEWELPDQGITALWGPSGSGKTSVFRLLLGLDSCPGLSWQYRGLDLASLPPPQRRIGVVFQSLELFPHMSAKDNIMFAARARKMDPGKVEESLKKLVRFLDLEVCLQRQTSVLSGGEQQRVALARALIGEPRFLFLDEPFSSLDSDLRSGARQLVKELVHQWQIPTLLVTHDSQDLKALADKVVKIRGGRLVPDS